MTPMLGIMASQKTSSAPPITGYKLWLDASIASSITSSGGAVSQWNDQSGNGYNFVQATGANQPITNSRTLNGKNTIDFDGTNDFMSNATNANWTFMNNTGGSSTFIVGYRDAPSGEVGLLDTSGGGSATRGMLISSLATTRVVYWAVYAATGGAPVCRVNDGAMTDNAGFYLTILSDPNNGTAANRGYVAIGSAAYTQGNTDTQTPSASAPTTGMFMGAESSGAGAFWNGTIAEVIIYPTKLSTGDATTVKTYLAAKWGL